jgi:hypothetical protein
MWSGRRRRHARAEVAARDRLAGGGEPPQRPHEPLGGGEPERERAEQDDRHRDRERAHELPRRRVDRGLGHPVEQRPRHRREPARHAEARRDGLWTALERAGIDALGARALQLARRRHRRAQQLARARPEARLGDGGLEDRGVERPGRAEDEVLGGAVRDADAARLVHDGVAALARAAVAAAHRVPEGARADVEHERPRRTAAVARQRRGVGKQRLAVVPARDEQARDGGVAALQRSPDPLGGRFLPGRGRRRRGHLAVCRDDRDAEQVGVGRQVGPEHRREVRPVGPTVVAGAGALDGREARQARRGLEVGGVERVELPHELVGARAEQRPGVGPRGLPDLVEGDRAGEQQGHGRGGDHERGDLPPQRPVA